MASLNSPQRVKLILIVSIIAVTMAFACFACSPSSKNSSSPKEQASSSEGVPWSIDQDCVACHDSYSASGTLGEMHLALGSNCSSCHSGQDLVAIHETNASKGGTPTRLKFTEVSKEACTACHTAEDLSQRTADSTILTDSEGRVVNPHQIPDTETHQEIACTNCHQIHTTTAAVESTARETCLGCHHMNVFANCDSCHD